MIAALFVAKNGPYFGFDWIEPWTEEQDARKYPGPWPVIAHPPCERWGRYWGGGPSAKVKRIKGDDQGCFKSALQHVRAYGGILEHPAHSHAWSAFNLTRPGKSSWTQCGDAWVCHVEQGHYGHKARKATWLYYVGNKKPFELIWGPSQGMRLDEGFHSKEERRQARAAGQKPIKRLSTKENIHTPEAFRDLLLSLILDSSPFVS